MRDVLRVLVVDDEGLVREGLQEFLSQEPDVTVAGECANGLDALAFLKRTAVDVVFLDVQMPEVDGLTVAEALRGEGAPSIVFVTAFNEHAIRAFDLHAVDYLLKPFDQDRFRTALDRVRVRRRSGEGAALSRRLEAVLAELQARKSFAERVLVKSDGKIHFVAVDAIDWIDAAGNYARLHVGNRTHLLRETIQSIGGRLDPSRFVRIHRSTVVNLRRILEMESTFNGEYVLTLTNGARLTVSRTYRDGLRAQLGQDF